ncbi:MAG: hypothetical protein ACOCXI_16280, partial [Chloroflexota bacterium]
ANRHIRAATAAATHSYLGAAFADCSAHRDPECANANGALPGWRRLASPFLWQTARRPMSYRALNIFLWQETKSPRGCTPLGLIADKRACKRPYPHSL